MVLQWRGIWEHESRNQAINTILFALYASPTVGRMGLLTRQATANQATAGLIAQEKWGLAFLWETLLHSRSALQNIAVGAAQQNINQRILKQHPAILPLSDIARAYSKTENTKLQFRGALALESDVLAKTRDLLLPKLISGELRVEEAEEEMGALA